MEIKVRRAVLRALEKNDACMQPMGLDCSPCSIPSASLSVSGGVIGKSNREKQTLTGLMAQMLSKLLSQVEENKGAPARNQQSWEMLWCLPVLLRRCKGIN